MQTSYKEIYGARIGQVAYFLKIEIVKIMIKPDSNHSI
jgi:hypothetical protein